MKGAGLELYWERTDIRNVSKLKQIGLRDSLCDTCIRKRSEVTSKDFLETIKITFY